jgi:hypothetical protein
MCVFAGGQLVFSQVITGGSVWKQGVLQAGDEIKQLDDVVIESMELPEITRLILGQVRICLSARMSAVVDCHNNRNSMTVTSLSKSLMVTFRHCSPTLAVQRTPLMANSNTETL